MKHAREEKDHCDEVAEEFRFLSGQDFIKKTDGAARDLLSALVQRERNFARIHELLVAAEVIPARLNRDHGFSKDRADLVGAALRALAEEYKL